MQLQEVPEGSRIRLLKQQVNNTPPDCQNLKEGDEFVFHRLDGMYSYCTQDDGTVVHIVAWAPVEIIPHKSKK